MPKAKNPGDFTTSHASPEEKLAEMQAVAEKAAQLPLVETLEGVEDGEYRVVVDGKVRPVKVETLGVGRYVQYLD